MRNNKANDKDGLIVKNSRRLAWKRIVFALGCIVVFCTTYALILPAITMEIPTYCGFKEHIHTDECYRQIMSENKTTAIPAEINPIIHHHTSACYDELGALNCGEADFVVHIHDENCYDEDGSLWCPLPEISLHIHDESCNIPQDDINEPHIHTDECYELRKKYICGFDAPETDIFGNEIVDGIVNEPTLNTDNSLFPAPPADEFAFGEVTTVAETDVTAEPALPALSEPVTETAAEPIVDPVSEPVSEPAVTEPFSEAAQTDFPVSDIMQNEAVTAVTTNDSAFGDIPPELGNPAAETVTTSPVHQHTDDCYIYEKVLICTKAEAGEVMDAGEYAFDPMAISTENYGLMESPEDPAAAAETEEPNIPDESGITDLFGTYDEPIVSDVPDNIDNVSNSDDPVISDGLNNAAGLGNLDVPENPEGFVDQNNIPELSICTLPEVILHEHTFSCYNESGELVCGMMAVRKHQHTQECEGICYIIEEIPIDATALTCEIPEGEGAHLHSFEYGCFDENMNIICPLEESLGHFHDIHCYGKWELICGMEEHEHTEECEIDPDNVTLDNEIMMLANADGTWGYYPDGSIYWNRGNVWAQVPFNSIDENVPYIIFGHQGNNLMGDITYQKGGFNYLKAIPKEDAGDYSQYERWYFERNQATGEYYIYYKGNDNYRNYLVFGDAGIKEWDKSTRQVILTQDKNAATAFTVNAVNSSEYPGYPKHIVISKMIDGETYYLNSYFGDKPQSNGNTTHWLAYPEYSEGSFIKLEHYSNSEQTAHRIPTVSSSNTIINMFDYWTASDDTEGRYIPDVGSNSDLGINKNHRLHFVYNDDGDINQWVGAGEPPFYNIVSRTLGNDGYPFLSQETTGSNESLAYLFDPDISHMGKASYTNVGGLLRNNDEGYFYFDCKQTMAEYNQEDNNIYIYDQPGVKEKGGGVGQFFPFNKAPQIMELARDDSQVNHYFGMTITTRFFQKNGGYTKQNSGIPTSFHFSGDDDVWIFIDDVLIGDGGGIHDACSIDINFVTGEVAINGAHNTTLNEAFIAAGKSDTTKWSDTQPATFADNTTHTLKFFYLERGNYSSNLELKYNLISIPKTAIYKVDQYGQVVPGAKFAVYAADADYHMLNTKDGHLVNEPESPIYNANGDFYDANGSLVNALYTGITNNQGEMIFEDTVNNVPLTLTEIREKFGDHFILREIKVPDGYRVVSKDVSLEIWTGAEQTILRCRNTSESGSRAAPTLQVTATDTIWLKTDTGAEPVTYYEIDRDEANNHVTTQTHGTLFAVVMKYTGPVDSNGYPTALGSDSSWTPVYGNDMYGYQLEDVKAHGGNIVSAAIEAAQKSQAEGNEVVFKVSPSCDMQVTLENLPGNIATYYRMLDDKNKKNTRYTVGFYWTSENSLYEATLENTHGVYSHDDELARINVVPTGTKGFERAFGANIRVPNLINKILVQKTDENNTLINGATFAIYNVHQDELTEKILYRTNSGIYAELSANYSIDSNTGVITDGSNTIFPLQTTTTSQLDSVHTGTGEFTNLDDGQYIVKEIKAPLGYKINTTDIMVLVTEDTIYANAGTENDGVIVGRGPGYVVNTLNLFASQGEIDNTLTWIYAKMRISKPSTSFYDIGKPDMYKGYI